ncbi:hypothetical protein B0H13DRAFT_2323869 [Mycena leptocephala]|nr:hypothetical protein B0H13DRAFT_2323869 [Mycena leptocephala]
MCHRIRTDNPKCASLLWIPGIKEDCQETNATTPAQALFWSRSPSRFPRCPVRPRLPLLALCPRPSHWADLTPTLPATLPILLPALLFCALCPLLGRPFPSVRQRASHRVAYLTADMLIGALCYRAQIGWWVHHVVYIGITETAVRKGWAHVFCLCAVMETDVFFRDVPLWASALGSELPSPDLPPKPSRSPSS